MVRLNPKDFITQLDSLYQTAAGSVYVTYKHFTGVFNTKKSGKGKEMMVKGVSEPSPMIIVHATDGNKKKFSTLVTSKDVVSFQISIDKIMRKNMTGFQK